MKLVIIPCGSKKIWDKDPGAGQQKAKDAYIGGFFIKNRQYAEKQNCDWLILSAKYGFIEPDFIIPGNYNVTFKKSYPKPISDKELFDQYNEKQLSKYDEVIVLGGIDYISKVKKIFGGANIQAPFKGLPLGKMMSKINEALGGTKITSKNITNNNRIEVKDTYSKNDCAIILEKLFSECSMDYIDIEAGELHRLVGGYPGTNHKMPSCCAVMKRYMNNNDEILYSPPSGKGASLKIRYYLPRQKRDGYVL